MASTTTTTSNQATLVVSLPADAILTIDDQPTRSTSSTRYFVSPPIDSGSDYYYTLKAHTNRDNQQREVTKKVRVRAGEESRVRLDFANAQVAQK
jgi:uncharacterized protein (TIGR03000 family)